MSDMEQSDVAQNDAAPAEPVAPETPDAPEVQATPVVARQPSNELSAEAQAPAVEPEKAPLPLEDAVRALLIFVRGHRTVGDSDLDAAIADVEAALNA